MPTFAKAGVKWLQHDDAQPHYIVKVRAFLGETFPGQVHQSWQSNSSLAHAIFRSDTTRFPASVGAFAIFRFPFRIFPERLFPYPYNRMLMTVTV